MQQIKQLKFEKYQGLGNDFIITGESLFTQTIEESILQELCPRLCDRHFGIGADGILLLKEMDTKQSIKLTIFNADGTRAEMCGNALRCVGKFLYLHQLAKQDEEFFIVTDKGEKKIIVLEKGNSIKVEMGSIEGIDFEEEQLQIEGEVFKGYFIEYGVPHFIIIVPEIKDEYLNHFGPIIEKHHNFKNGTNVDFIKKISRNEIQIRTFERGCGETLACGTGACSAVITGILLKQLDHSVKVCFAGGELQIAWNGNKKESIIMVGTAGFVFNGTFYY